MAKSKKKVTTPVAQAPEVLGNSGAKFLSHSELLEIETLSRDLENARLLMAVEEQNIQNKELEIRLMRVSIEKAQEKQQERNRQYKALKAKYESVSGSIWAGHGIDPSKESVGYNPLTGEIVVN